MYDNANFVSELKIRLNILKTVLSENRASHREKNEKLLRHWESDDASTEVASAILSDINSLEVGLCEITEAMSATMRLINYYSA